MMRMPNPHQSQIDNYNRELLIKQQQEQLIQRQRKLDELHNYRNRIVRTEYDKTPELTDVECYDSTDVECYDSGVETNYTERYDSEPDTDSDTEYPDGDENNLIELKIPDVNQLKKLSNLQNKDTLPEQPTQELEELLRPKKPKNPSKPKEYILCNICNKQYTRTNATSHRKTQYHQLLQRINQNIMKNLLVDPNNTDNNFVKKFI